MFITSSTSAGDKKAVDDAADAAAANADAATAEARVRAKALEAAKKKEDVSASDTQVLCQLFFLQRIHMRLCFMCYQYQAQHLYITNLLICSLNAYLM